MSRTLICPISRTSYRDISSGDRRRSATQAKLSVIKTRARPSRRIVDRRCINGCLRPKEAGHGRTLWTRRRIEDTRPSIVDPVSVLDAVHGSHRVTQKKERLEPSVHRGYSAEHRQPRQRPRCRPRVSQGHSEK